MNDLIKQGSNFDTNTVEYVPTAQELCETFPRLPSPDKVKLNTIKCAVQIGVLKESQTGAGILLRQHKQETMAFITFSKMNENGKNIWIYEGKVKL